MPCWPSAHDALERTITEFLPNNDALLDRVVPRVLGPGRVLVGIDGVDGAGKTTLADHVAERVRATGRPVVRASVDGFHRPAEQRYRRGRASAEGYYRDSYDLEALRAHLLDPCSPAGSGVYRDAVFDVGSDQPVAGAAALAPPDAVVIVDGLFLHRPELRDYWDYSVFLEVDFEVSVPRGAARGAAFGSPDPAAVSNRRYVDGNRLYFREAAPREFASLVVDYNDLARPAITAAR